MTYLFVSRNEDRSHIFIIWSISSFGDFPFLYPVPRIMFRLWLNQVLDTPVCEKKGPLRLLCLVYVLQGLLVDATSGLCGHLFSLLASSLHQTIKRGNCVLFHINCLKSGLIYPSRKKLFHWWLLRTS